MQPDGCASDTVACLCQRARLRWCDDSPLDGARQVEGLDGPAPPEAIRDGLATLDDWEGGDFPVGVAFECPSKVARSLFKGAGGMACVRSMLTAGCGCRCLGMGGWARRVRWSS